MKRLIHSGTALVLIAVAFLAFTGLASWSFTDSRLDLTEQKLYTLSDGSRRILNGLSEQEEPLQLYFFYSSTASKDLVTLRNYAKRVEELLQAYQRAAHGKIRLQIIDPAPFSAQEDQAAAFGLQAVPLNQGGDQLYFGLAGTRGADNTQVIPFFTLDEEELLEYQISRLLQSLATPEQPVVGVLSGLALHGGFDMQSRQPTPPWRVLEEIRQQFQIESLQAGVDLIPAQVSVLLLVHPKNLPEQTLYAIDQFVLRGGKLLVFVDPFSEVDTGASTGMNMGAEPIGQASDLQPLFAAWGLRLVPDQVLGDSAYAMTVGMGQGQPAVRHAAWLNLPTAALNQQDVSTAGLQSITVASAGLLEPLPGAQTQFVPLLQSSTSAMPFAAERMAALSNPQQLLSELQPTGQRYTLAARISGPAQSAYPNGIEGRKDGLTSAKNIQVIAVADTDMLSDRLWVQMQDFFGERLPQPWADNGSWVINALDNLTGSDALISVRSRGRFSRPFEVVERLQRDAEAEFREKEQVLQARLAATEEQLLALQQPQDPSTTQDLTREQQAAMQQFLKDKLAIRRELRDVRYQLDADIDALGRRLKFINIALVPLLLTLGVLALWFWRRRKA